MVGKVYLHLYHRRFDNRVHTAFLMDYTKSQYSNVQLLLSNKQIRRQNSKQEIKSIPFGVKTSEGLPCKWLDDGVKGTLLEWFDSLKCKSIYKYRKSYLLLNLHLRG